MSLYLPSNLQKPLINILYPFQKSPWGGGNQFLKTLRSYLKKKRVYVSNPFEADIILFNSYPFGKERLFKTLKKIKDRKNILVVHRIDGPIVKVRGKDLIVDKIIFSFNQEVADATIFQSVWSRKACKKLGLRKNRFETIIINASDPKIFCPLKKKRVLSEKTKLIATSWSSNPRKGFSFYKFLDKNLDFKKYQMTLVGNSPLSFTNIKRLPPKKSKELAKILRRHHVYITASRDDPCSNSLIEALHCGLPAVALASGGHPEIIGKGGLLFSNKNQLLNSIDFVAQKIRNFQNQISLPAMEKVGKAYYHFFQKIYQKQRQNHYQPKPFSFLTYWRIISLSYVYRSFLAKKS